MNDRARDVIDLLLLRDLISESGEPTPANVRAAIEDIFAARAREVTETGGIPRAWPARVTAYPHWETAYAHAAETAHFTESLHVAVAQVNEWLDEIEKAE